MQIQFHIYRNGSSYNLSSVGGGMILQGSEAECIDMAVRVAQDMNSLYAINYWRP